MALSSLRQRAPPVQTTPAALGSSTIASPRPHGVVFPTAKSASGPDNAGRARVINNRLAAAPWRCLPYGKERLRSRQRRPRSALCLIASPRPCGVVSPTAKSASGPDNAGRARVINNRLAAALWRCLPYGKERLRSRQRRPRSGHQQSPRRGPMALSSLRQRAPPVQTTPAALGSSTIASPRPDGVVFPTAKSASGPDNAGRARVINNRLAAARWRCLPYGKERLRSRQRRPRSGHQQSPRRGPMALSSLRQRAPPVQTTPAALGSSTIASPRPHGVVFPTAKSASGPDNAGRARQVTPIRRCTSGNGRDLPSAAGVDWTGG